MRFERNYKNVKITVSVGDIIRQQIGAIINPANHLLIMGGGVAGAIRHVGRREIENEALRKRSTKTRANPPRKAIATWTGDLKAKYAIYVPTRRKPAMIVGKKQHLPCHRWSGKVRRRTKNQKHRFSRAR